ncbi:MAG: hypothetical protein IPM17_09240 [Verrucomicrobia bacterium]|nr:hypothetical protein [Verrucomicrobiota bacterium]
MNADVAPSGYLKVAVRTWSSRQDLPGRTFAESDRIIGNSLVHRVTWKSEDKIGHQGRPVMLRVQMRQAKLFAFEFD